MNNRIRHLSSRMTMAYKKVGIFSKEQLRCFHSETPTSLIKDFVCSLMYIFFLIYVMQRKMENNYWIENNSNYVSQHWFRNIWRQITGFKISNLAVTLLNYFISNFQIYMSVEHSPDSGNIFTMPTNELLLLYPRKCHPILLPGTLLLLGRQRDKWS